MNMYRVFQAVFILAAGLQQPATVITAPVDGQTIQSQVTVGGTIGSANFASAELSFAYASDPTGTWFLVQIISQPSQGGTIAVWDTTNLTDGDYRLRLRVYAFDGSFQDYFVNDLHLRNEAPSLTATPALTQTEAAISEEPSSTPALEPEVGETPAPPIVSPRAASALSTPLPPPPNPAAITVGDVYSILGRGALLVLLLFIIIGVFLRLRRS